MTPDHDDDRRGRDKADDAVQRADVTKQQGRPLVVTFALLGLFSVLAIILVIGIVVL